MKVEGNIYWLQYGAYTSKEVMEENLVNLDNYIISEVDNKYYVYLGLTLIYENAHKLENIFLKDGINLYIKSDYLMDSELLNEIKKKDKEILDTSDELLIKKINQDIVYLYNDFYEN